MVYSVFAMVLYSVAGISSSAAIKHRSAMTGETLENTIDARLFKFAVVWMLKLVQPQA